MVKSLLLFDLLEHCSCSTVNLDISHCRPFGDETTYLDCRYDTSDEFEELVVSSRSDTHDPAYDDKVEIDL